MSSVIATIADTHLVEIRKQGSALWAAEVMRSIIGRERKLGAARLQWGWIVEKHKLYACNYELEEMAAILVEEGMAPELAGALALGIESTTDIQFDSFAEWMDHVIQDPALGIGEYSTIKSLTISFSTIVAPWLSSNHILDADGLRVTPERFIDLAGVGKIGDVNGAIAKFFRVAERKRIELEMTYPSSEPPADERAELGQAIEQFHQVALDCIGMAIDPSMTREDLDDALKAKGYRESRRKEPAAGAWSWGKLTQTTGTLYLVSVPHGEEYKLEESLWIFLQPEPADAADIVPTIMSLPDYASSPVS